MASPLDRNSQRTDNRDQMPTRSQPRPLRSTRGRSAALQILADLFCFYSRMAAQLLGTSERNVQAIYQRLIRQQLVYAKAYNTEVYVRGALPKAFGLTDSGVRLAFRDAFATDSTKTFRGHAIRTIEHELM